MKPTVMQAALIAGIEVMKDRIEKAIIRQETWIHILDHDMVDGKALDSAVRIKFDRSELTSYWLRLDISYQEGQAAPFDCFTLHISMAPKSIIAVITNDKNTDGSEVFFDPLDDLATVLDALASFEQMPDKLEEMVRLTEAVKAQQTVYEERRARFKVVDSSRKDN